MNHNLDSENQGEIAGDGGSIPLPAHPSEAHEEAAFTSTHDAIRKLNRDTTWVAAGLLSTVIFAALVLALLECHPKANDPSIEAGQTTGGLLLDASPATPSNVTGLSGNSFGEVTSSQATSGDRAFNPEINHPDAQANADAVSPAPRPESANVIRPKIPKVRYRSYTHVGIKARLIALWHQSLRRRENSRGWTLFSNSNQSPSKKISYTAGTKP
jgi:hypothetical protein